MYFTPALLALLATAASASTSTSTSITTTAASSVPTPTPTTMAKVFPEKEKLRKPITSQPYEETAYPPPMWAVMPPQSSSTSPEWFTDREQKKTGTGHPSRATALPKRGALHAHGGCKVDVQRCYYHGWIHGPHGRLSWGTKWHMCEDHNKCVVNDGPCYIHKHKAYCNGKDRHGYALKAMQKGENGTEEALGVSTKLEGEDEEKHELAEETKDEEEDDDDDNDNDNDDNDDNDNDNDDDGDDDDDDDDDNDEEDVEEAPVMERRKQVTRRGGPRDGWVPGRCDGRLCTRST